MLPLLFVGIAPDLVGSYRSWFIDDWKVSPVSEAGPQAKLELKADGTFGYRLENHVMAALLVRAWGKYEVQGSTLILKGVEHLDFDDGYRKGSKTQPFRQTFTIRPVGLTGPGWEKGAGFVLRRNGEGPPLPPPRPTPGPSNAEAVALLRRVEAHYAALKSYRDEGTMTSNGRGFQPKRVRFSTHFSRPNGFRFEASLLDGKRVYERHAVWIESGKSWLGMSGFGPAEERPLSNGLGILDGTAGHEASLISTLLMPKAMGKSPWSSYEEIRRRPDEGPRAVVELWKNGDWQKTLWIDRRSLLIQRVRFTFANEEVVYRPQANVSLTPAELVVKARKKSAVEP